jgi:hypothetical protein
MWRSAGCLWNQHWLSSGSTRLSPGLAYFIALTLAVLNPLACMIHCAAIDARAHQGHAHETSASGISFYLCDMSLLLSQPPAMMAAERISTQPAASSALPRAVYEGVALPTITLSLLVLLMAFLTPLDAHRSSRNTPPPFPPPRTA